MKAPITYDRVEVLPSSGQACKYSNLTDRCKVVFFDWCSAMPPFSIKFFNPSLGDEMECFWQWVAAGANITACNSGEEGNGLFVAKDTLQGFSLFYLILCCFF